MNKPTPSSLPATTRNTASTKDQTAGYYHDIDWMPVYQANLNPNHIEFVLDANGKEAPDLSSVCEIAYGFGYSLVLHAACNANCQFTGTDFNPRHYDFASSLSSDLGLNNLALYDQSIEEFCGRPNNTQYDFIGLTGTWSWLPASNQNNVLAFAAASLGEKGLLCFDYMTRPGGDTITTLRTAMLAYLKQTSHGNTPPDATTVNQVQERLLEFAALQPAFLKNDKGLKTIITKARENLPEAFVHELLNLNWQSFFFTQFNEMIAKHDLHWEISFGLETSTHNPKRSSNCGRSSPSSGLPLPNSTKRAGWRTLSPTRSTRFSPDAATSRRRSTR